MTHNRCAPRRRSLERGATMIEILVALVVTLFGLFAMLGLNLRTYRAESESYQRSQALILVEDMAQRIRANRTNVANYAAAASDPLGTAIADCTGLPTLAATDMCEWENLLRGAAEVEGGNAVGAMSDAGRCVTVATPPVGASGPTTAVVTGVWRGSTATGTTANAPCVPTTYSAADGLLRYVSTIVRFGDLDAN
jgi:type IV pilus assembly protein PilV